MKRERPKPKESMDVVIRFRLPRKLANRIRHLARIYAKGDLSKWLRHASVNCDRKFLVKPKNKKAPAK